MFNTTLSRADRLIVSRDAATTPWKELTLLHLRDELLVEQAPRLLVQRAVDRHHVALAQHLLQALHAPAADLLLLLQRQRLVVEVEQLLAVEGLEPAQHALADAAHGHRAHHLVLQVKLVLGRLGHVPAPRRDLLVRGHEVAHQGQDGHDDVLGDADDVGLRQTMSAATRTGKPTSGGREESIRPSPRRQ